MQKIMIIEDEISIRDELSFLLNNEGYATLPITDFFLHGNTCLTIRMGLSTICLWMF